MLQEKCGGQKEFEFIFQKTCQLEEAKSVVLRIADDLCLLQINRLASNARTAGLKKSLCAVH